MAIHQIVGFSIFNCQKWYNWFYWSCEKSVSTIALLTLWESLVQRKIIKQLFFLQTQRNSPKNAQQPTQSEWTQTSDLPTHIILDLGYVVGGAGYVLDVMNELVDLCRFYLKFSIFVNFGFSRFFLIFQNIVKYSRAPVSCRPCCSRSCRTPSWDLVWIMDKDICGRKTISSISGMTLCEMVLHGKYRRKTT